MHVAYQQSQNHIINASVQAEEEIASGPHELESSFARTGPRSARGARPCTPIPRRGSASNMLDQSIIQVSLQLMLTQLRRGLAFFRWYQFQHVLCVEGLQKGLFAGHCWRWQALALALASGHKSAVRQLKSGGSCVPVKTNAFSDMPNCSSLTCGQF